MPGLPASIEGYLRETGFSTTELLVLSHLLGGGSMTLRQLAAKTGKSTGVLDQATKKLLQRGILEREQVNEGSRFAVDSLNAIRTWLESEQRQQLERQRRRSEDLEAFLETISFTRRRPHLEYYEGETAFADFLHRLLAEADEEILQYLPISDKEEHDPYFEARGKWTRKCGRQKIQVRVIAPDTMLGRRYSERDALEHRVTALLQSERCQFSHEQFFTGDWLGSCDHHVKRYSLIRFPEFVRGQRFLFHSFWKEAQAPKVLFFSGQSPKVQPSPTTSLPATITA